MELNSLKKNLDRDLYRSFINTSVLLGRFRILGEEYRSTPAYMDAMNFPFYYHLGKYIQPKKVLEVGFELGYRTGCFFQSCKTVEDFQAIATYTGEYYNARLGLKNIKSVYKSNFKLIMSTLKNTTTTLADMGIGYDLAFVNQEMNFDECRSILDTIFKMMKIDGLIVCCFLTTKCKDAFLSICKIHNREYLLIPTRYGTGITTK